MTTHYENDQKSLRLGLQKASDIITSSMGGSGSTVIISNNGRLRITKDGVSIAKSIQFPDPMENIGAQLLISAADKTVRQCGDGTTLTSLLLSEMVKNVTTLEQYRQLEKEVQSLKEYIGQETKEIETIDDIAKIAYTSTGSEHIGSLFKDIYEQTDFDTHVQLEKSDYPETYYKIDKGFKWKGGFTHNFFINQSKTQECILENPYFHITPNILSVKTDVHEKLVIHSLENDIPIVFVAYAFSKEFIRFVQMQVMHRQAKLLCIKVENFNEGRVKDIEDLKAYLSEDMMAKKVISNPYYTIISNDDSPYLKERLDELKQLSNSALDPLEQADYQRRYYTLSGNIATIFVGGNTEESRDEEYDRIEDAIGATTTAIRHGYVIGMGKVFCEFVGRYPRSKFIDVWTAPIAKICENALVSLDQLRHMKKGEAPHIRTLKQVNLLEEGIIDPAYTLICALDNALTNTRLVLNTKYTIHNEIQSSKGLF